MVKSLSSSPSVVAMTRARSISASWVSTTALAGPVVPEVKNRKAASWPEPRASSARRASALGSEFLAFAQQIRVADQLGLLVVPHAPILVVNDALDRRTPRQDREQLVDLLLILGEDVGDCRALERSNHLLGASVLVSGTATAPNHCAAPIAA